MRTATALAAMAVVLVIAQVAGAAGNWVSLGGAADDAATVAVLSSDESRLVLSVEISGLLVEDVETSGGVFSRLSVPGADRSNAVGEALLPVVREFVEMPLGAETVVTVLSAEYRTLSLRELGARRELLPVQAPVEKIPGAREAARFERSAAYYALDEFGPSEVATLSEAATMRGHHFAQLEVRPVRYNPARGEVAVAARIEIAIDFVGGDMDATRRARARLSNGYTERMAADTFVNHGAFAARYDIPLPVGYLIVCYDSFTDEIAPLVAWKEQKGYQTTVVSTADIPGGNTKENIKAYIQDAYDTWVVPPTFVLLVGDTPQISHWVGTQSNNPSTDLYYVTMDGSSDWLPDIWIGRFSCQTAAQVTNLVNKTVDYETWNLTSGTSWIKKAVFMASTDNHTVPEATHEHVIREYLDPRGYYSQRLYSYNGATTQDVRDAFNDGRSLGIYSGHGDVTYWADGPVFRATDVNSLTNTDMLPLVHSYSCLTGQFSSACFGETWTNAVDKGAVVFWGSSVTSYWDEDDILERGAFKACFLEGYTWACGISHRALYWVYDHYSGGGSTRRYFEMYNVLGDPSLDIWTDVPSTLNAVYAGTTPAGATTFDITVTSSGSPVDHALVCIAKADEGVYETAYTNASGIASIAMSPSPMTPGEMAVTVTKHDCYPHEGSTTVTLADSPYVVYESHVIDDDTSGDSIGDGDGVADAGEYIELVMTLENIGTQTGTGITATISENEPDVLVMDSYEEYGTIAAGGTAVCLEDYDIYVAPNCPDGHTAQIIIQATDGDSLWTSVCNIPISAPVLTVTDYAVDEAPARGNGNGCAEPGESVTVSVELGNGGGDDAAGVEVTMTTSDAYVTVTQGLSGSPFIASGGSATLTPEFVVSIDPGAPGFHEAVLELDISTASGYSTTQQVTVLIGGSVMEEDFEITGGDWAHYSVTGGFVDQWHMETYRSHSTTHSWKFGGAGAGNYSDSSDGALETPVMCVGSDAVFSFWHWLSAEEESGTSAWDCALVEVSTDEGSTWSVLVPDGGYSHTKNSNTANPVPPGTPCWSGSFTWREETFDLAAYEGQRVIVRFRFASDGYITQEGWYVDDVALTSTGTGVGGGGDEPLTFALRQNAPNPFNPVTTIAYSLPERSHVAVRVFNVAGRLVATLVDGVEEAGERSVVWDGRNDAGEELGSGVYFCSMTAGDFTDRKMMVLLK